MASYASAALVLGEFMAMVRGGIRFIFMLTPLILVVVAADEELLFLRMSVMIAKQ